MGADSLATASGGYREVPCDGPGADRPKYKVIAIVPLSIAKSFCAVGV
ncbi:hypothetical protein [Streptomyces sp. NPDC002054]